MIVNDELIEANTNVVVKILGEQILDFTVAKFTEIKNDWDLVTTQKICELLEISKPTLEKRVKEGHIIKYYLYDRTYFSKSQVQEYIKSNLTRRSA